MNGKELQDAQEKVFDLWTAAWTEAMLERVKELRSVQIVPLVEDEQ